ncbi:hypothetical protein MIC448_60018 [Microbacterium sp. C448]|nr:hypothetical protein MIC448_60018 [Microbacterium sp. C448]
MVVDRRAAERRRADLRTRRHRASAGHLDAALPRRITPFGGPRKAYPHLGMQGRFGVWLPLL